MQRELYERGGLTRWYWDYRDRAVLRQTVGSVSILDVGAGEGITTRKVMLQSPDSIVLGIDPNGPTQDRFVWHGDVYRLGSFRIRGGWSCVLLLDVIEHLERPHEALKNCFSVLLKDGKIVVLFPNDKLWFIARLICGKWRQAFTDWGHKQSWTAPKMGACLNAAGFSVVHAERIGFGLHTLMVGKKA